MIFVLYWYLPQIQTNASFLTLIEHGKTVKIQTCVSSYRQVQYHFIQTMTAIEQLLEDDPQDINGVKQLGLSLQTLGDKKIELLSNIQEILGQLFILFRLLTRFQTMHLRILRLSLLQEKKLPLTTSKRKKQRNRCRQMHQKTSTFLARAVVKSKLYTDSCPITDYQLGSTKKRRTCHPKRRKANMRKLRSQQRIFGFMRWWKFQSKPIRMRRHIASANRLITI